MDILIKNGHIIDPDTKRNEVCDLLISDGKIAALGKDLQAEGAYIIDAANFCVMPGFIDLHVHLREPGFTHKETIKTGAMAAAHGGFTTIVAMPNTKPSVDCAKIVREIYDKAKEQAPIHVLQAGAITKEQAGEVLSDIEDMVKAGIPAISEDGKSVMNAHIYKEAMKIAAKNNIPILAHCEDIDMVNGGYVNEDEHTKAMGLKGISNSVEDVIVARDIMLANDAKAHLHLCHCSTKGSMEMLREAKKRGLMVSGEVCPHHFILTTEDIVDNDANYKMNPPLRTREDVEALKLGLKENVFDVISTDHAPHTKEEKEKGLKDAPFGIVGLETALPLTVTKLVKEGVLSLMQMAEKMSYNPAKILGIDKGSLAEGKVADIVIFDMETPYKIDKNTFLSKGKNTPFDGWEVYGKTKVTICNGKIVWEDAQ